MSGISFLIWKMSFISSYHFMDLLCKWRLILCSLDKCVQGIMTPTTVEIFSSLKTCNIFIILNYSLKYFWYFIIWGKSHCTYSLVLCVWSGGMEDIKTQNYRESEWSWWLSFKIKFQSLLHYLFLQFKSFTFQSTFISC